MKERNVSIDLLKCFAALLITNSHMNLLYGKYDIFATGGCFGDALFFFCSGFTLFLKPMQGIGYFLEWYKRRINRIYPSILAVAFMASLFFNTHWDVIDIILARRYWFVSCIMLYYIAIFFIGSYFKNRIYFISLLIVLGTAIWFFFVYQEPDFSIYGGHYIRWLFFFVFMLLGAQLGTMIERIKCNPLLDVSLLFISIICFYALFIFGLRYRNYAVTQLCSIIPLLSTMYYFYKVGASQWGENIYRKKICHVAIRFIGGLWLEIYLVQHFLFTDKMNNLFPMNILFMLIIIIVVAYLVRCFARLLLQTFNDSPYEWKKIVSLY